MSGGESRICTGDLHAIVAFKDRLLSLVGRKVVVSTGTRREVRIDGREYEVEVGTREVPMLDRHQREAAMREVFALYEILARAGRG